MVNASLQNNTAIELGNKAVSVLQALPQPVLVTCTESNRASALTTMYLAKENQWDAEEVGNFYCIFTSQTSIDYESFVNADFL